MKPREYRLMQECVERGIRLGLSRAHKHDDYPSEEVFSIAICDAIMLEICESWSFDDDLLAD